MLYKKLKTVFVLCLATAIASTSSITYATGEVQSPIVEENNVISEENVLGNVDIVTEDDFFENELAVLELKNIVSQKLYYKGEEVKLEINGTFPLDLEEYYVEIKSSTVPAFYGHVIGFEYDSKLNKAYAIVDAESFDIYGLKVEIPFVANGEEFEPTIVNTNIATLEDYDTNKAIAYDNVKKLAPWLSTSLIVDKGNTLSGDLSTKRISFILPFDVDGKHILGLTKDTVDSVKTIKVVFEDKTFTEYGVTLNKIYDEIIVGYSIANTGLEYQFNNYVNVVDDDLKAQLVNVVNAVSYTHLTLRRWRSCRSRWSPYH